MEQAEYLDDIDGVLGRLSQKLETVRDAGGCVSILIHPDKVAAEEKWLEFYREALMLAGSLGAITDGAIPSIAPDQILAVG